jgi:hypothetical protein
MKEEFLHYVWKYGLFDADSLKDDEGNQIGIIHPGQYNHDAGPDFFNARIKINETEWAGNVEIHVKASDFTAHGHHRDHSFDNVILHIVYINDRMVRNARGQEVLTVKIEFDDSIFEKYTSLVNNPAAVACHAEIKKTDRFLISHWLHSLLVERLTGKSEQIKRILSDTGNDWEETFYRIICRYFGFRVNTGPFEMLAASVPFRIIKKHLDNRFQVESLLFGSAGMLEDGLFRNAVSDSYYLNLTREYRILSAKYDLKPIHGWLWKFSKLRPVNFPTVRISQLSAMLAVAGGLFSRVIEAESTDELRSFFEVSASEYWDNHYVFGKESRKIRKRTGETATDILLINSVIPVLFSYGLIHRNAEIIERALAYLEDIAPEDNRIIREWTISGVEAGSAFDSQALLWLRNEYCTRRRCLDCRIGAGIVSTGAGLKRDEELLLEP